MSEPTAQVSYRPVEERDFADIQRMYASLNDYFYTVGYRMPRPENVGEVWLESFRRTLGRFSQVFVAEVDGKVVGFMLCRVKRVAQTMGGVLVGEVSDVWVEPEVRRGGVARSLCLMGIDWMKTQNVHSIEVQVLRDNEGSQKFFESLGFLLELRMSRLTLED
jgi:ribosomal protein S18 acetylase RimI-like enzyme